MKFEELYAIDVSAKVEKKQNLSYLSWSWAWAEFKKKCPNAYDADYVSKIENFVHNTLPILLLVWYYKLDEARALKFFEGSIDLTKLLSYCTNIDENIINNVRSCKTLSELQNVCINNDVYKF